MVMPFDRLSAATLAIENTSIRLAIAHADGKSTEFRDIMAELISVRLEEFRAAHLAYHGPRVPQRRRLDGDPTLAHIAAPGQQRRFAIEAQANARIKLVRLIHHYAAKVHGTVTERFVAWREVESAMDLLVNTAVALWRTEEPQ